VSVIIGMFQLQAQSQTYTFLVSCPGNLLDPSESDEGIEASDHTDSDESLSLLTQFSRLDYYDQPETVDLKYLDSLVKASHWLSYGNYEMTTELWVKFWNETPAKTPGRLSNLLHHIFHRIDIFESLSLHLDAVQEHVLSEAQHNGSMTPHPPDLTSLYAAFQSSLDEELCRLHNIQWSPGKCTNGIFSRLFNMVRENDPTVWVMGLPPVMRIIDREISKVGAEEKIPITVMQALNDISVLAVCVRETWKHYNFESHVTHRINLINELESVSVVENLGGRKLKSISPQTRHLEFWAVVDNHMKTSSQGRETNEVIDMIQRTAPIDTTPSKYSPVDMSTMHEAVLAPSDPPPNAPSPGISPMQKPQSQLSIVIEPTENKEFWAALLAPSSENSTELRWTDFCNAMIGIGYRKISMTGSVYRFENDKLGTIIFHAPHGGDKLTHRQARMWWLRRLSSRFEVRV
jgi:hypothetical protein